MLSFIKRSEWASAFVSDQNYEELDSQIKGYTEALAKFNVDTDALENINNYISNAELNKKTFIHKKDHNLPFSLAYNPDGKVFLKTRGLPPVGFGSTCNLVTGVDLNTHSKVVYRTLPTEKVTQGERDINIILSERPDLFVATKEIYDYEGSFGCDDKGFFICKQRDTYRASCEVEKSAINQILVPKTCFILEYLSTDLFELIDSGTLSFQDKIDIACDIAKAIEVMHNKYNVVHRDLKIENICILKSSGNKKYQAKIADFGQSEFIDKMPLNGGGTDRYIPPEWLLLAIENEKNKTDLLLKAQYSSDMWSLGVIFVKLFGGRSIYEFWGGLCEENGILNGYFPLYKENLIKLIKKDGGGDERLDNILRIIEGCLELNPEARITACEIVDILENRQGIFSNCNIF